MSRREAKRAKRKMARDEWTVAIQQIQRRMKIRMAFLLAVPVLALVAGIVLGRLL